MAVGCSVAWLILVILSSYIRLYPYGRTCGTMPASRRPWSSSTISSRPFSQQILSEAPTMPPAQANQLAEEKLNETMHTDNQKVMEAIEKATIALANQPGAGPQKIYLLESDPYDFYNLTENIVHTGRIAAVIKGSKYFNPLMCAPFGCWQPFTLHPYWGFVIYKFLQIFDPHISLMAAVAYVHRYLVMLIIIDCFFMGLPGA